MKKKLTSKLLFSIVSISTVALLANICEKEVLVYHYNSSTITPPSKEQLKSWTLNDEHDTNLNDNNFPNHYPVQLELNEFLWYGIIPFIELLGQDFVWYDSGFGTAKTFVASVLSAINNLGQNNSSITDKKMYPIKTTKQPFNIVQRFQKDSTVKTRNFGPNSTDTTQDPNENTSWIINVKPTLTLGLADKFNIPGFTGEIKDGVELDLNADLTKTFYDVVNYDEHLLSRDFFMVLCDQMQSKTSGSTDNKNPSYWQNLSKDLLYSGTMTKILNPFDTHDSKEHYVGFSKYIDDFTNNIVKRDASVNTLNLSWGGVSADDPVDKHTLVRLDSGTIPPLKLINMNKGDDYSLRSWFKNNNADANLFAQTLSNREFDKTGTYDTKMPNMFQMNSGLGVSKSNPFNYFFEQSFLGVAIYGGFLPNWFQGNSLLSVQTKDYLVSDKIFNIYFKANYSTGPNSLYSEWIKNDVAGKANNYYEFADKKLMWFFDYATNILNNELYSDSSKTTVELKATNIIIKPHKYKIDTKLKNDAYKDLSEKLKKLDETKTDFNFLITPNDWVVDILNNYSNMITSIDAWDKLSGDSYNLWIILGVLTGFVVAGFLGYAVYREIVVNNLRKRLEKGDIKNTFNK